MYRKCPLIHDRISNHILKIEHSITKQNYLPEQLVQTTVGYYCRPRLYRGNILTQMLEYPGVPESLIVIFSL